jgi:hypothetical protein
MSRPGDRITIPTNGHHALAADSSPAESAPASSPSPAPDLDRPAGPGGTDVRFAVTPGQAIVGFGILASLILLFLGRRRGRGQPAARDR